MWLMSVAIAAPIAAVGDGDRSEFMADPDRARKLTGRVPRYTTFEEIIVIAAKWVRSGQEAE